MSESLEIRRKRLKFRSWHRGTKEMDLLVGSFADRYLAGMTAAELDLFEPLLDLPEPVLYAWVIGRLAPDPDYDHPIMKLLIDFKYVPINT
jgi:antitoxin CptB